MIVKLRLGDRITIGRDIEEKEINVDTFEELGKEVEVFATENGLNSSKIFLRGAMNIYKK